MATTLVTTWTLTECSGFCFFSIVDADAVNGVSSTPTKDRCLCGLGLGHTFIAVLHIPFLPRIYLLSKSRSSLVVVLSLFSRPCIRTFYTLQSVASLSVLCSQNVKDYHNESKLSRRIEKGITTENVLMGNMNIKLRQINNIGNNNKTRRRSIYTPVIHILWPNDATVPAATDIILFVKFMLVLLLQVLFEEKHVARIDTVKANEDVAGDGYESNNLGEGEREEYVEVKGEWSTEYSKISVR